jgi:hypothetical protein
MNPKIAAMALATKRMIDISPRKADATISIQGCKLRPSLSTGVAIRPALTLRALRLRPAHRPFLGRDRHCAGTDDARRTGMTPPNPLRLN